MPNPAVSVGQALRTYRKKNGVTQAELADTLGMARKTYILFEGDRWFPPHREVSHFVTCLHDLDPAMALAIVAHEGETLEDHAIVRPAPVAAGQVPQVPLEEKQAKLVFDAAIYGAAEDLDVSPRAIRPVVAAFLAKLAESGMPLAQAATIAKTKKSTAA